MDLELRGRRALITGSTAGIGYAIAETLAREGAAVVVNGRSKITLDRAIERIRSAVRGAQVSGIAADCGNAAGTDAVIEATPEVDILVNNLGIYEPKPFFEIPDDDWRRFFDVNVMSGVRLARAYGPGMKDKGWGRILFISSESGLSTPPEMVHYGMTKTAQLAVARGLAATLAGSGVTVNSVLPGPTRTEGVEEFVRGLAARGGTSVAQVEADFFQKARPTSLLNRLIEPQEVANLCAFLCGAGASAMTGAALRVEGGVVNAI